eukprot:CAMPEP_0118942846 /NCGR_PEP_ID=MMETSP1169-20130426/36980_1 /TAXON_ID=36882 /ORGANISM="Pyramimonas obovata, Strain CCMP722" /LENGTH=377 /DNA_ID=CAMNT_0006887939 /DNA_START=130 /DNA_END=1259 /DNA_ORIENTATION=-
MDAIPAMGVEQSGGGESHSNKRRKLMSDDLDTVVPLSVGGMVFKTMRSTLEKSPFFCRLFQPGKSLEIDGESVFVDRDGQHFDLILSYLRGGDLIETDTKVLQRLKLEAQFYGLDPLATAISERLSEPVQCFKYYGGAQAGTTTQGAEAGTGQGMQWVILNERAGASKAAASTSKGACTACAAVDDAPKVGCRVCRKVWHRTCTDPPVTTMLVGTPWVCPACMAAGGVPTKGKVVKKQVVPLTTNAKLAVIRWKQESEAEGGTKLTWREIGARLVQEGFCPVEPEKSTMSKIYKERETHLRRADDMTEAERARSQRVRESSVPGLNAALLAWCVEQDRAGEQLKESGIVERAKQLGQHMTDLPKDFRYGKSWFQAFR